MAVSREPTPSLSPYVRRYYGFREDSDGPMLRREGPGVDVVVLLSFGPEWRIGDAANPALPPDRRTSFAAGLRLTSVLTEHDGSSHGAQVSLTPCGAFALLGVPMHELAGRTVPLDALLGPEADRLVEGLVGLPSWAARFELLDTALGKRLPAARRPTPEVMWAWGRLSETQGRVRVESLLQELGWSRKRLLARFREEIGVTPKSLARLIRFERAAALLESAEPRGLADVALSCGYYDQSHLTNEFRRIAGVTPALHAATFLQDGGRSDS
jgi:AraC-like DNA-binding protein